jgi:hypothetical protein
MHFGDFSVQVAGHPDGLPYNRLKGVNPGSNQPDSLQIQGFL